MSPSCTSRLKFQLAARSKSPSQGRRTQMSSTERDDIREVIGQTFVAIGTLARALHVEDARLEPTLNAITAHAAAAHPAAKDAGLILLIGGKLIPQATTGKRPNSWT